MLEWGAAIVALTALGIAAWAWSKKSETSVLLTEAEARLALSERTAQRELVATTTKSQQIEMEHDQLKDLISSMGDGLIVVDEDRNFLLVNPAAEHILGMKVDARTFGAWSEGSGFYGADLEPMTRGDFPLSRALAGEEVRGTEVFVLREGMAVGIWISITASPLVQPDGVRTGALIVLRDETARKRAENQREGFLAMVSHELRTPMTSILGALQLVNSGAFGELPEPVSKLLRVADANADREVRLLDDILMHAKVNSGQLKLDLQDVSALEIVRAALEIVEGPARHSDVEITTDVRGDLVVRGDPGRLAQALANLLTNAIKYSPEKGVVDVVVVPAPNPVLARFCVVDRGPGIPADVLPVIFQEFRQVAAADGTRRPGTGLGLAISKALVGQHGGRIGVKSTPGEGSTFYFDVPRA